jgi:hypothetical protein
MVQPLMRPGNCCARRANLAPTGLRGMDCGATVSTAHGRRRTLPLRSSAPALAVPVSPSGRSWLRERVPGD